MKFRIFVSIFLSACFGVNAQLPFPVVLDGSEYQCKHFNETTAHQTLLKSKVASAPNQLNLNYIRLELEVDPNILYLKGKVTSYFSTFTTDTIYFDLSDSLRVDSVLYHGNPISFNQFGNDTLEIYQSLNGLDSVSIFYQGIPDTSDGRSIVKDFQGNNDPVIWTLSQPYGSKNWWPSELELRDKADSLDVIITTPSAYIGVSNGLLVKEVVDGNLTTYFWKHRYPIDTYLVAFAVSNYKHIPQTITFQDGRTLPVENYAYPQDSADWIASFGVTNAYMQQLVRLFGDYPFMEEHYGHVQFNAGGGMEHQTMSFMANTYPPLIGHELAHQWFGNMVTTDSWNHIWLNEGLATFSEAVARERIWPNEALRWRRENIESVTSEPGGSVRIPFGDTLNFKRIFNGRLSYQKGALILHMLRWKIGDSALFSGLRSYLNQAQTQYFYANSNQLTQAIDQATKQELDLYFSDWLYGEGYPSYEIEVTQNNGYLNIMAHQTQSLETNFFELPIPIYVSGNGQDTIYRLEHRYSGEQFLVEVPFEVDSVAFDPEKWLISNQNSIRLQKGDLEPLEVFIDPYFEELRISTSNPYERLDIYYIDGRLVYTNGPNNDLVTALPLQHWIPGVYIVRTRIKGKDYSKKAILPRRY